MSMVSGTPVSPLGTYGVNGVEHNHFGSNTDNMQQRTSQTNSFTVTTSVA